MIGGGVRNTETRRERGKRAHMASSPQAEGRRTDFDDGEVAAGVNGGGDSGFSPARSNRVVAQS